MRTKINDAQRQDVIRRYLSGERASDLAHEYNVTRQTIYWIINKVEIKRIRILGEKEGK
jgi:DNA invertase Pin-like site-specific DNA recombinase